MLGGGDATLDEAFAHANDVLKNAVGGIAAEKAMACPLLEGTFRCYWTCVDGVTPKRALCFVVSKDVD